MPLRTALLVFNQKDAYKPVGQKTPEDPGETTLMCLNDDSSDLNTLPPINVDTERFPVEHALNSNANLQRAMAERKPKCVKARSVAVWRKGPQRPAGSGMSSTSCSYDSSHRLQTRELVSNQLRYRHLQSIIRREEYRQWLQEHTHFIWDQ